MANVWRSIRFTVILGILLSVIYPLFVTLIGNLAFPFQAKGSMVRLHGHIVGSQLIAQKVTNPGLFWPRPSFVHYAANGSGASNYGPTNPLLVKSVAANLKHDGVSPSVPVSEIPPSMVESSGSGLDPDITITDALLQIPRISKATGIREESLKQLVAKKETGLYWGLWGTPMVNVMELNLALERRLSQ
ncbi:MAG: potassium-transporting ATPase subunit KdpC [Alicyclobacillaceae bacterium]|nr:potassium-transporting ATPase subunit KdpC [Alicyclobacillaceae bacterium]